MAVVTDFDSFENIEWAWNVIQFMPKILGFVYEIVSTVFVIADMSKQLVALNITR